MTHASMWVEDSDEMKPSPAVRMTINLGPNTLFFYENDRGREQARNLIAALHAMLDAAKPAEKPEPECGCVFMGDVADASACEAHGGNRQ